MIWPFAARGARAALVLPEVEDLPPFDDFLVNDAVLKLWLPAKLAARVDWLSAHHGSSRPDILRSLLFEHVYGRVALRHLEIFARKRAEELAVETPMFSRRQTLDDDAKHKPRNVDLDMLGKSDEDFKLHLPRRLKGDLEALARAHHSTASQYTRGALIMHLLGGKFHSKWSVATKRT
jgi:hypothetical protein